MLQKPSKTRLQPCNFLAQTPQIRLGCFQLGTFLLRKCCQLLPCQVFHELAAMHKHSKIATGINIYNVIVFNVNDLVDDCFPCRTIRRTWGCRSEGASLRPFWPPGGPKRTLGDL